VVDGEMAVVVGGEQARVHHPLINNMLEHELPMCEYPRCVHRVVDGSAERGCIAGKSAWSPWAADVCSGCSGSKQQSSGGKQQSSGGAEELPKEQSMSCGYRDRQRRRLSGLVFGCRGAGDRVAARAGRGPARPQLPSRSRAGEADQGRRSWQAGRE
jgi:hypothetical protein